MEFTYRSYKRFLQRLSAYGYEVADYRSWRDKKRCVILRHDIDNDIRQAVTMAQIEQNAGVSGTYFVMLTSDFYNVFSRGNLACLHKIMFLGHEIGLHFDEMQYPYAAGNMDFIREKILWEAGVLGELLGSKVNVVSMHRPGKAVLESDLRIPGMINSYGQVYFEEFKYLSDSRRRWREPVDEIIENGQYDRLHILTHAFWYHEKEETVGRTVERFVNSANWKRYESYRDNFTDLSEVMLPENVKGRM